MKFMSKIIAIGYDLKCPPLVLFSLIAVGFSSNALGGAGGPLAVLVVAIFAIAIYAVIPRIKTLTIFSIALSF